MNKKKSKNTKKVKNEPNEAGHLIKSSQDFYSKDRICLEGVAAHCNTWMAQSLGSNIWHQFQLYQHGRGEGVVVKGKVWKLKDENSTWNYIQ